MKHLDALGKFTASSRWTGLAAAALFALTLAGCGGSDGKDGAPGKDADPAVIDDLQAQIDKILDEKISPETCSYCHTGDNPVARTGPMHQEKYNELYQDGVAKVSGASFTVNGTTATLTFKLTNNSVPVDCTKPTWSATQRPDADFAIGAYWAAYDSASRRFTDPDEANGTNVSLAGTKSYNATTGVCTFTKTGLSTTEATRMSGNGIVQIYGADGIIGGTNPATTGKRLYNAKYPFAAVLKVGTVDYSSTANVTGCQNCHTQPFLKHTYIYGQVDDGTGSKGLDFYVCKGCHLDNRSGGHQEWQILKDDPERFAEIAAHDDMTAAEKAKYAYKTKLMNDVHMSHAMEFAYPQGMNNCITCHADKTDPTKVNAAVVADDKFTPETCKSCHAIESLIAKLPGGTSGNSHESLFAALRDPSLPQPQCGNCHQAGAPNFQGPTFAQIHNGGYNPLIYSSSGVRYSNTFVASVDSASVAGNILTLKFSATGSAAGLSASDITPTILVGLYGYNSKDFIVAAHSTASDGKYNLEYLWDCKDLASCGGSTRTLGRNWPTTRFEQVGKTTSGGKTTWELKVNLSNWANDIVWNIDQEATRSIRRAEISVMPQLKDAKGRTLGLDAPSKTFNFRTGLFENYFTDIVDVKNGCNTCHAQLATTFHSGIRGGNIKVCRTCHVVSSGGSNLELQSRSIDSYVHAVHSFQGFNPGDVNFGDPVEATEYTHHVNSIFPRFGVLDCESCHVPASKGGTTPGTPNVPNQGKSMPGILSATDNVERDILAVPSYVTGPAVRACGACHRAQALNADDAGKLSELNAHFRTFGYLVENTTGLWESVVAKIMGLFRF
ncbi:MAG TPA: hypothetical protein VIT02_01305 [Burkholderiaceae bacterium]